MPINELIGSMGRGVVILVIAVLNLGTIYGIAELISGEMKALGLFFVGIIAILPMLFFIVVSWGNLPLLCLGILPGCAVIYSIKKCIFG